MPPNAITFMREWKGRETNPRNFKKRPNDYSTSVLEMDNELAKIRKTPSKVTFRKFFFDLINF